MLNKKAVLESLTSAEFWPCLEWVATCTEGLATFPTPASASLKVEMGALALSLSRTSWTSFVATAKRDGFHKTANKATAILLNL